MLDQAKGRVISLSFQCGSLDLEIGDKSDRANHVVCWCLSCLFLSRLHFFCCLDQLMFTQLRVFDDCAI